MNAVQITVLVVVLLVGLPLLLLLGKLVLAALGALGAVILGLLPIALWIAGLVSCLQSDKPTNTKLLWVIIIVIAPVLGALLWFFWGKKNT